MFVLMLSCCASFVLETQIIERLSYIVHTFVVALKYLALSYNFLHCITFAWVCRYNSAEWFMHTPMSSHNTLFTFFNLPVLGYEFPEAIVQIFDISNTFYLTSIPILKQFHKFPLTIIAEPIPTLCFEFNNYCKTVSQMSYNICC